jgi:histidinol-phosphate aminotransferase
MIDIQQLIRPNVRAMQPYSSARDEFKGKARIWLDANESPFDSGLNRYPDPLQIRLKHSIAYWKKVELEEIFLGNGSDEAIDLLFRAFCEPRKDKVMILPPTYGMYRVTAALNDIEVIEVPLNEQFQPDVEAMLRIIQEGPDLKLIFFCSPNNPTGNAMNIESIERVARAFSGLVVVDRAYGDFDQNEHDFFNRAIKSNIVILATFSKAFGLAAARLGMAFAMPEVIAVLNKIKPPYNVNVMSQEVAMEKLESLEYIYYLIETTIESRKWLRAELEKMDQVVRIYPSDANFLLVQFNDAERVYRYLASKGIVVRDRRSQVPDCLRITVGEEDENEELIEVMKGHR